MASLALATALSAAAADEGPAGPEWIYSVAPGDTLFALAKAYLEPPHGWRALQRLNRVGEARALQPGQPIRMPVAWLRTETLTAEVVFAHGSAQVQAPGAAAPQPARSGQALAAGALLTTGPDASMSVRFADGSRMLVAPNTRVTLDELRRFGSTGLRRTRLGLERGGVETEVVPLQGPVRPFEIRTPVATLAVRGTEFRARAADGAGVEVLKGSVGAAAGREVALEAGFGTVVSAAGAVAEPKPLLPAPALPELAPAPANRPFEVQWPAVEGARSYRAQVFAAADGALVLDGRFGGPAARWPRIEPGAWRLRVRAIDELGIEGRDAERAFERGAEVPEGAPPPEPAQPFEGSRIVGPAVVFSWTAVESGRRYVLQIGGENGFDAWHLDLVDGTPAQASVVQRRVELVPGRYRWRVAALDENGQRGPFSAARAFEVVAP